MRCLPLLSKGFDAALHTDRLRLARVLASFIMATHPGVLNRQSDPEGGNRQHHSGTVAFLWKAEASLRPSRTASSALSPKLESSVAFDIDDSRGKSSRQPLS